MITSWERLETALTKDEPLPLLAIQARPPRRHPLLGSAKEKPEGSLLDHDVVQQELVSLASSLHNDSPRPSVFEALVMESPQTIGSIAAATALDVKTVADTVQRLTEAGLAQPAIEGGVERASLTISPEK